MKTRSIRQSGFTLVEIMIVVAINGLLAAIAIPNFVRARNTAQQNTCLNNIRQIENAVQQWALENKKTDNDFAFSTDIAQYIKNGKFPTCPSGGTYAGSDNGTPSDGRVAAWDAAMCTIHGTLDGTTPVPSLP